MALFKRKKNIADEEKRSDLPLEKAVAQKTAPKKTALKKVPTADTAKSTQGMYDIARVLRRPRITEKATLQAERRVYVFEVAPDANKKSIAEAVKRFYKVTPVKVNIAKIPAKKFFSRARRQKGVKTGGKKAYVYLKEGDKIEIV